MSNTGASTIKVIQPSLPKGGGDIKGMGETFSPHAFSGAMGLELPIPATPCRGFAPDLAIQYGSGTGNGSFGLGWELSLPDISLQTSKHIPRYDSTDCYLFSGNAYLVQTLQADGMPVQGKATLPSGIYLIEYFQPRIAANFDLIGKYTNTSDPGDVFWTVTDADNITTVFGKSANGRVFDPKESTRIFRWLPEELYDAKGNHQLIRYKREDGVNIPEDLLSAHRDISTQVYISKVQYGNDSPVAGSILLQSLNPEKIIWHFEIVFDYGEYILPPGSNNPYQSPQTHAWTCRLDPFSDYSAGFDIRTYRLCRNIMLFHRFPASEYGSTDPVLVRALSLSYNESSIVSLLTSCRHTGFYYLQESSTYDQKSMPAFQMRYSDFEPSGKSYLQHSFQTFSTEGGIPLTGLSNPPDYQLADLTGAGIPGILYSDEISTRFQYVMEQSDTAVTYARPADISFPVSHAVHDRSHTLAPITDSGRLDLMVTREDVAGFYERTDDGWKPWQSFISFPTSFHDPVYQFADLTGDGLTDLLLITDDSVQFYPSLGASGFGAPIVSARPDGLPLSMEDSSTSALRFSNICGSGLTQLVRITNGSITCWPSLGYGRFGAPVQLLQVPDFGEQFDTARLFLADINCSGLADLIYVHVTHIAIYMNEGGNCFREEPILLQLPLEWSPDVQIQFADVTGTGSDCLVFSCNRTEPLQWYYDFNLREWTNTVSTPLLLSMKPYLLIGTDNGLGARTFIRYASSNGFYLADQAAGRPWITRLPFPVQVVAAITHLDQVSNSFSNTSYRYHHGYYDAAERQFQGFGCVDQTDTEEFFDFLNDERGRNNVFNSPACLTKTWYHTGAAPAAGDLSTLYQGEYWQGDACSPYPGTTELILQDSITLFNELTAAGVLIVTEVGKATIASIPAAADLPIDFAFNAYRKILNTWLTAKGKGASISVSDLANAVQLPLGTNGTMVREACMAMHGSILRTEVYGLDNTPWETNPYTVTFGQFSVSTIQPKGVNTFGVFFVQQVQEFTCEYERNPSDPRIMHTMCLRNDGYGHAVQTATVNYPRRTDQIADNLPPMTQQQQRALHIVLTDLELFNSGHITDSFHLLGKRLQSRQSQLTSIIPQNDYFTLNEFRSKLPAATRTHLTWERDYYYDADQQIELHAGVITAQGLYHRTEYINFNKQDLTTQFAEVQTAAQLSGLLQKGGYVVMPDNDPDYPDSGNYFWNPGAAQSYYPAAAFYLPRAYYNAFQYSSVKSGVPYSVHVPCNHYTYDPYLLIVIAATDPLGNSIAFTTIDYQYMQPVVMQDINQNMSASLLDPLGVVIASTFYGHENGTATGFGLLSSYHLRPDAKLGDVMSHPLNYLQCAATFFYYDILAWETHQQPVCIAEIVAEQYPVNSLQQGPVQRTVTYIDGFGRHLQTKTFLDSAEDVRYWDPVAKKVSSSHAASCWVTSAAVRYNNKGLTVRQFEPFFSPDYLYISEYILNEVGVAATSFFDAMDQRLLTITPDGFIRKSLNGVWGKEAKPVYQGKVNQLLYGGLPYAFSPSPWIQLDFDENDTISDASYQPSAHADVNAASVQEALGCYNTPLCYNKDPQDRVIQFSQLNVTANEANLTCAELDIRGWELRSFDERMEGSSGNFNIAYSLSGAVVKKQSVDAGTTWDLQNVENNHFWEQDLRGTVCTRNYDILQRLLSVHVYNEGKIKGSSHLDQTVQLALYGDSQDSEGHPYFTSPEKRNLRGQQLFSFEQSGLNLSPFYTITGRSLASGKVLSTNYQTEVNWTAVSDTDIVQIGIAMQALADPTSLSSLNIALLHIAALEITLYTSYMTFDALGREITATDPDGNVSTSAYYRNGWLRSVECKAGSTAIKAGHQAQESATPGIRQISYNEKGQQTSIAFANDITTSYGYDPLSYRLVSIQSAKTPGNPIQDIRHHHDPAGNITFIENKSIPDVFFQNQLVSAKSTFKYDTLYRLIMATGREHTGMSQNWQFNQNRIRDLTGLPTSVNPVSNGKALRNYSQAYSYDSGNNLTVLKSSSGTGSFTRTLIIRNGCNRLSSSNAGMEMSLYNYDLNGNQLSIDGLSEVAWNYRNNLQYVTIIPRSNDLSDREYYIYDSKGMRVRKVRESRKQTGIDVNEIIYFGAFEIRRRGTRNENGSVSITREWHWVSNANCRWGYIVTGTPKNGVKGYQLRYQLKDQLESSTTELDETGRIIAYEEYYPYGGTSIIAAESSLDVKQRYYRYSGKEADDSSGLYYYGMRYYCCWLGRWLSADPAGTIDGLNLYAFVKGNPVTMPDIGGMGARTQRQAARDAGLKITHQAKGEAKKKRKGMGYKGRAVPINKKKLTQPVNAARLSAAITNIKDNTLRSHWKGFRDDDNCTTTGIPIFETERDPKSWTTRQKNLKEILLNHLKGKIQKAEFADHLVEVSHTLAGSLYGSNDELNAFAASVHQNTEWLVMETAVKDYARANPTVDVRIKLTAYVHSLGSLKGTLKASRFKILLDGNLTFDRTTLGNRDAIDLDEAGFLYSSVMAMKPGNFLPMKNQIADIEPPDVVEMNEGTQSSLNSPAFTDVQPAGKPKQYLIGQAALNAVRA